MEHIDTIVVGGGQAGLATGYHLARLGRAFVILDSEQRIGDGWRRHWDSLRLFTPGRFSGLPGMANPVGRNSTASKDEFADYLQAYANAFALPTRSGVTVTALSRSDDGFVLATTAGPMTARQVVVAGGPNRLPRVPDLSLELDPGIRQLHSSEYRNPSHLPAGDVLVVGAGTSGAQIALELATTHRVTIAGRPTVHIPDAVFHYAGAAYWWLVSNLLTVDTPPGRRVAAGFGKRGAPLISVSMRQLDAAGITRLPRITGVQGGHPVAGEAGPVWSPESAATVIWATGYRPDVRWLPDLPMNEDGLPVTSRGVVDDVPGLYFVGMPFQYALTSGLIGGVGRDAAFIADRVAARATSTESGTIGASTRLA
ncbi:flavin-containing monooxygenase [Lacisediminihabitans profunda]|uniref:FAD-dependent oxidoreductase n=1 Tax=Lacisediminihabitans profunda TaxID=2594790 RepID=A0A5C8UUG0_9MICO|nr:NAD(P)/FAD-dependent oxidoreductase [Lacisediminihabitans profunda]TXN31951.1 FAD-dependent oxidoreductase [Lacisediminihabitans profunda]